MITYYKSNNYNNTVEFINTISIYKNTIGNFVKIMPLLEMLQFDIIQGFFNNIQQPFYIDCIYNFHYTLTI